jgi:hypothetical protein
MSLKPYQLNAGSPAAENITEWSIVMSSDGKRTTLEGNIPAPAVRRWRPQMGVDQGLVFEMGPPIGHSAGHWFEELETFGLDAQSR